MAKLIISLLSLAVVFLSIPNAQGSMDCKPFSKKGIVDQLVYTCPKPFINSDAQAYCCYDKDGNSYCCELPEFLVSTTAYLLVVLLILLLLTSLISCVCCLCCPCCVLYKRRQSGVVYRNRR